MTAKCGSTRVEDVMAAAHDAGIARGLFRKVRDLSEPGAQKKQGGSS
jgi:hypothetical protein